MGHVRDLPGDAKEIPAKYKAFDWSRLGVNVDNDFEPLYIVPSDKKAIVRELKDALADSDQLILATDEDREGESISWHLHELLQPKVPVKRMVFHEITKEAIQEALEHTRDVDDRLVRAQETRRILDRLVGYTLSPLLWKKIAWGLSAGRVQSVAMRLLVVRERERRAFRAGTYWDLVAQLRHGGQGFKAELNLVGGKKVATGSDFDESTGKLVRRPRRGAAGREGRGRRSAAACSSRRGRSPAPRRSRASAGPGRRSPRPRCSRKPTASSGCRRATRCARPRACTSAGSSPTCVPTRCTSPTRPSRRRGTRCTGCTARSTCRPSRGATRTRAPTRRKRTRRSVPPARSSSCRARPDSTGASSRCTTSSGSARWRARWPMRARPASRPPSRPPTPSSAPPASASTSPGSSAPTWRDRTIPRRRSRTRRSSCRRSRKATRRPARSSRRCRTRRSRRRATPKRRW